MDKTEVIGELKRKLCEVWGYDENLKFVGSEKPARAAVETKAYSGPRDFLNFAIEDSAVESERNRINCLSNCKRAIDSQVDRLIQSLGFLPLARKQHWSIPRKFEFISDIGIVAPRILHQVTQVRNRLEHEFALPSKLQVEDSLDIATLFISYAELVRVPTMNWTLSSKLSVRYDYDQMVFRVYERDPEDASEAEPSPLLSLAYGEDGFQGLYEFLMKTLPLMERRGQLGEDL